METRAHEKLWPKRKRMQSHTFFSPAISGNQLKLKKKMQNKYYVIDFLR